jgi:glycogen operon protein
MTTHVLAGHCHPLGASVRPGGVNFCVFSKNCTALELLLFDGPDDPQPARVLRLDPARHKTFYYWHVFVPGLGAGQVYAYRVDGPFAPAEGHRFDGTKVLLDPYGRAVVTGPDYSREAARQPGDNCAQAMRSVVVDPRAYDWEGDTPLQRPFAGSILYELHVGGFTRHPSSGVSPARRGTFAGLRERIPYLQELGVSAVELLPIQQFDEYGAAPTGRDYWGYNPIALFAPHRGYSSRRDPLGPVDEFRDLVKALHRAGIEVILDVVFNHTAEGDESGPIFCFRGLENRAYYLLAPGSGHYTNYSGCGNTFNGNHSIVRRLILECLHYWVQVMHVDGFRFDLASILARDETGQPLQNPPVLWEIESDPILAGSKIIAEAWDAAGLYQVGTFVGHRWAEWNGPFRDDVRRFVRGDPDTVGRLACRLRGSPDLFPQPDRDPHRSVNFLTCHDGFTLQDLVAYNHKHNEANGENNRDGCDGNFSWNCGTEGPTADPQIQELRLRQMKNLLTVLLMAQGTPMLLMGDEGGRTQGGNNNAYCQDNDTSWLDWDRLTEQADLRRFLQGLIRFRREQAPFRSERFWTTGRADLLPEVTWHGVHCQEPDWSHDSHSLAFSLRGSDRRETVFVILNAYWGPLEFELPKLPRGKSWHRVVDTALPSPEDLAGPGQEQPVPGYAYRAGERSAVILLARSRRPSGAVRKPRKQ